MTDKQIIIDGVDVSGCASYMDNGECISELVYSDYCKVCPNCTYKLEQKLKAKEQECEELKKDVIEALKLVEITSTHNTFQETKINRLSKTLTEIKVFFKEECLICKENYINITGEICKECKYQDILKKINEVENER